MTPSDTKDRILDSAEKLFALQGIDATSLRAITAEAGVNLAAVNYHFQSKDSLVLAVIGRRANPINARRLELLDALEAKANGAPLAIEDLLYAMIAPFFETAHRDQFGPMLARLHLAEPQQYMRDAMRTHLLPVATRFWNAARRSLPHLSVEELGLRVHFVMGAVLHTLTATHSPVEQLGIPVPRRDPQRTIPELISFLSAGLRAPSHQESSC